MITCIFNGELGNNLFTLAALINKALDNNLEFCIPNTRNCYISINTRPLEISEMFEYNYNIQNLSLTKTYTSPDIQTPQIFEYTPFEIEDNTQITGYFQSEKYFKNNKNIILNKYFLPKKDIINYINQKYSWINNYKCLSIHVRVGGDRNLLQHSHKNISLEYYTSSINKVLEIDPTIEKYVIFSDNISYCKEIFGNDKDIIYIENEKNYIDLFLMSMCKHNIIANSTFSWWGAYFNQNPNKIIIAPKTEWFGPSLKHLNLNDLFPQNWITI